GQRAHAHGVLGVGRRLASGPGAGDQGLAGEWIPKGRDSGRAGQRLALQPAGLDRVPRPGWPIGGTRPERPGFPRAQPGRAELGRPKLVEVVAVAPELPGPELLLADPLLVKLLLVKLLPAEFVRQSTRAGRPRCARPSSLRSHPTGGGRVHRDRKLDTAAE